MSDGMFNELALERRISELFGLDVDIQQVIAEQIPVSRTSRATVFLNNKKQLYAYIEGQSRLQLGDVQKMVSRMGLKSELYLPPKSRPQYFDEIGRDKFREVFPGRSHINDSDIMYYRTLAPYNPALVLISEVKNGEIYRYDSDSSGDWRIATKFAYRRIRTS
ncbi:MAG TPA: hypothetical protein PK265_02720 [Candidatus Saccharibacteria bacterium]|nr:hypothetical protein [Candidatus Saccharibacteria bacterium]HRQ98211.1 hypothetical protein [Candidatus Saccharibacteria bacterium]